MNLNRLYLILQYWIVKLVEKERNTSLHSNNELENPVANVSSDSGNTSEVFEPIQVLEVWNYNSHLYTLQKLLSVVL